MGTLTAMLQRPRKKAGERRIQPFGKFQTLAVRLGWGGRNVAEIVGG